MEGKRFIKRIKVQNLLSFDEEGIDFELEPLNVLIGANGSGKSNLVDVIDVLTTIPSDFTKPFTQGGGISGWLREGKNGLINSARIAVEFDCESGYEIEFGVNANRPTINEEVIWRIIPQPTADDTHENQRETITRSELIKGFGDRVFRSQLFGAELSKESFSSSKSMLRSPFWGKVISLPYPSVDLFQEVPIYRAINISRPSPARLPQSSDLPGDHMLPNRKNIGSVLSELLNRPQQKSQIISRLKELNAEIVDVRVVISGGTVQVFFQESGSDTPISLSRISDGTFNFLCLLLILLHPSPPPLVCIEEPELGLHPDMIHKVAELLKEASQRMQLIVTTHSDLLVSALSDMPEAIVVCEHDGSGTRLKRLEREPLEAWLKDYKLGQVWLSGEIGGTRW